MNNRELQEVLREIEDEFGRVTPEALVEKAQTDDRIHARFDWDNDIAGHRWRLQQARQLIHSVMYIQRREERIVESVHYVRDPDTHPHKQGYRSVESLLTEEDVARRVLLQEFTRIGAALRRARQLAGLFDMESDMTHMEGELHLLQQRVDQVGHS